jgi:hypothetical protein
MPHYIKLPFIICTQTLLSLVNLEVIRVQFIFVFVQKYKGLDGVEAQHISTVVS